MTDRRLTERRLLRVFLPISLTDLALLGESIAQIWPGATLRPGDGWIEIALPEEEERDDRPDAGHDHVGCRYIRQRDAWREVAIGLHARLAEDGYDPTDAAVAAYNEARNGRWAQ